MAKDQGTYDTPASKQLSLDAIIKIMQGLGAANIYVKELARNDNSKNQIYLGGNLSDLSFIPSGEVVASTSESEKTTDTKRKIKYQAPLNLLWVGAQGNTYEVPHAKLIYYPQYAEVRFSGFLLGSKVNISKWMAPEKQGRSEGRWLILGVTKDKKIYAYLVTPECTLSNELASANYIEISKVLWELDVLHAAPKVSTRGALIQKLQEIHHMGWIPSQKLSSGMVLENYKAPNGGGITLEAMLGISPNGIPMPDYLGWEVKQFGVTRFPNIGSKPTTLMTPEPNGGYYKTAGAIEFVRTYGYADKSGKADRINFGGKHLVGQCHRLTGLTMQLAGFDAYTSSITDATGAITLLDKEGNVTASWSFAKLMDHWKRKHAKAVYIPCIRRILSDIHQYSYGKDVELGIGTNIEMFLSAMNLGTVYYDPGIKLENASSDNPKLKLRSQFRVNHKRLDNLYENYEFIDVARQGNLRVN
jgi:MvaI/BcnI restriction endonuclease family